MGHYGFFRAHFLRKPQVLLRWYKRKRIDVIESQNQHKWVIPYMHDACALQVKCLEKCLLSMHIVSLGFANNYNAKNTILDGKSTGIHCWEKKIDGLTWRRRRWRRRYHRVGPPTNRRCTSREVFRPSTSWTEVPGPFGIAVKRSRWIVSRPVRELKQKRHGGQRRSSMKIG